ncbi:MAG: sulfate reduction electron transfer complex DsrMKJOP subunit DsrJ [Desulfobaccales bacterium]
MADKYQNEFGGFAEKPKVPKKFYDLKYILLGLVIFFGLVFSPILPNLGKIVAAPSPNLDTPAILKLAKKDRQCVMPTPYMRAYHMQMLIDWREAAIRHGNREFISPSGKKYVANLSDTCMGCHSNKSKFCDQCHNFAAVTPNCWGCHQDMEKKEQKVAQGGAK